MIIKGTEINNAAKPITAALQKKSASSPMEKGIFARRFDTLELSDIFKKYTEQGDTKNSADKIREMLMKTETPENAERLTEGLADYAYMQLSLLGEAMRTDSAIFSFSKLSEQKDYYQGLLDRADAAPQSTYNDADSFYGRINKENAALIRENRIIDRYEYVENEDGTFDREKAAKALSNVQERINKLIEETREQKRGSKADIHTFNKCAAGFAEAFGTEKDALTLTQDSFAKLFGTPDVTEEDFLEKMKAKSESLWKSCNNVNRQFKSVLDKIRKEGRNGSERADNLINALGKTYGTSMNDVIALLSELENDDEE